MKKIIKAVLYTIAVYLLAFLIYAVARFVDPKILFMIFIIACFLLVVWFFYQTF